MFQANRTQSLFAGRISQPQSPWQLRRWIGEERKRETSSEMKKETESGFA